jgi:elongator complex protein 3
LINQSEILFLRRLGVTHIELGVQILDDKILNIIDRGHSYKSVVKTTKILKDAGFKISYHLMPNLPGSSPQNDWKKLKLIVNSDYCPDHLKIYPTVITKYSQLADWQNQGKYKPYSNDKLIALLTKFKSEIIPPWMRISRLGRDITDKMMISLIVPSNLREIVYKNLRRQNKHCSCIRCREIKSQAPIKPIKLRVIVYPASGGKEFFLEYIDQKEHCLGFLRLRLLADGRAAIVRELHVYGPVQPIGQNDKSKIQHQNLGKKLLKKSELIAQKHHCQQIKIISGIGVRSYYRKLGYRLKNTYMTKRI